MAARGAIFQSKRVLGPIRAPWRAGPRPTPLRGLARPSVVRGLRAGKKREITNKAPNWPGIKRVSAPGRVRPPPWEDALATSRDARRWGILHHKSRGTIVAGVPPRSDAALCCARLMAGKKREIPTKAPPWPGIKRLGAPGRVRPPSWEDALLTSQDAWRQGILHHRPRGTIVAGVHPRSDAALCCTELIAGKTRKIPTKAPLGPVTSANARRAASDFPQGRTPF